ncbi:MAG: NYN domain-containing protein, partial [Desulfocucumaceae bacterium]
MKEYLVVDGYNIIFAWPEFEKLRKTGMNQARARLEDIL